MVLHHSFLIGHELTVATLLMESLSTKLYYVLKANHNDEVLKKDPPHPPKKEKKKKKKSYINFSTIIFNFLH